jgi:hypothetical protein
MSEMQEIYDLLVQDIKLLVQYDDKYTKIDNSNIIKPNIMTELEKKINEIKQKQSNILIQIKTNNDKKELLEVDMKNISTKQTEIEKEISELNSNTNMIQEKQQHELDQIDSKCKELEKLIDTIYNKSYKESINEILLSYKDTIIKLSNTIFNDKILKHYLIEMYIKYISTGIIFKENKIFNIKDNNYFANLIKNNDKQIIQNDSHILSYMNQIVNNRGDEFTRNQHFKIKQELELKTVKINQDTEDIRNKIHIYNIISNTINKMNKILEEKRSQDIINFNSLEYNTWFNLIVKELNDKYYSIDNLFDSSKDKLLFTNYIIDESIKNNITVPINLELYNKLTIKNLLYDFQLIKELQNNIVINNIKICALGNTHIDYRKEMKKNNIHDNNNYRSPASEHSDFIEFTKLKETIKNLEEMEIEISSQLEQLKNTEINVESIEQHLKLTKMHKDIKKENNDNMIQLLKLESSIKEYIKNRNKCIKKYTNSNQVYFSNLTKLISTILDKPIDLTIDTINIYNEQILQLEKQSEEAHDNIILLYKFINELLIDTIKSNYDNIKIIQPFIKKEIELNTMITKNIDINKQKNEEIHKILTHNKKLEAELNLYNTDLYKFLDEYIVIEKVYNLRKLYSV